MFCCLMVSEIFCVYRNTNSELSVLKLQQSRSSTFAGGFNRREKQDLLDFNSQSCSINLRINPSNKPDLNYLIATTVFLLHV